MSPHVIIDKYNLVISLLITIAWQLSGFAIAWTFKFDKITDFTGGSNFFILALITLTTGGTYYARNIVASVLMMVWAARLAGFLLFRVLKTGSDTRFDDIRSHFFKFAGFWTGQILWVWVVSLPVVVLNSPAVSDLAKGGSNPKFGTGADIAGIIIFAIGLFWEATADIQKWLYKSSNPPKGKPCTKGLWYYSRHPPYFGEITLHWGLWALCISPTLYGNVSEGGRRAQYASITSPLFTILLLMFLSGLPTAEKPAAKKYYLHSHELTDGHVQVKSDSWDKYKHYLSKTSILFPVPPKLYRPLPEFVKRYIFLDLPMYKFNEREGREALEEERRDSA
ncbi:hypothetical protein BD324DRAFT_635770 [Kockovaella imperatae]|uniref:Steroid 5-alpha reductase C-terminal domain-containing protein n=1 Tax=Kockovaella imperatae TaxID=4999 RepID=A0A1Y1UA37_9TREE|nr:hypothetical protein BD324DRAFT_635770 [Kockovaella imperatae]ORX34414.1 hypothetical protein BD324DRAFT_635770 [Kockovaella imperatae]